MMTRTNNSKLFEFEVTITQTNMNRKFRPQKLKIDQSKTNPTHPINKPLHNA